MYSESEISNALMHQKDSILNELRCALEQDPNWTIPQEQITNTKIVQEIVNVLEFNCELWKTLGYGYKGIEIAHRIMYAARHSLQTIRYAPKRKNSLTNIITRCNTLTDTLQRE